MTRADGALLVLVEDDRSTRESLRLALSLEGYRVIAVPDGAQGLEVATREPADLLIVDLGLPHIDGLSLCRMIRQRQQKTPILILTARTEVSDRVAGLDAGADDYLAKPFSLEELLARVRALLRRSYDAERPTEIELGDMRLDEEGRLVWRSEQEIELTKTEFDLLALLARNRGHVLSHSKIYEEIWDDEFVEDSKNLAVYIGYLRRKLEAGGGTRIVHTVRGAGYVLRP